MSRKSIEIDFTPPNTGEYTLELVPAFTSQKEKNSLWKFQIEEKYYYSTPVSLDFENKDGKLYPGNWNSNKALIKGQLPAAPGHCSHFGNISIINVNNDHLMGKVFIHLSEQ